MGYADRVPYVDGPRLARTWQRDWSGRMQSYVRPLWCGRMTAGPDGVRGSGPICGRPPSRKDLAARLVWSNAVICPAFVVRSYDRWPRWGTRIGSHMWTAPVSQGLGSAIGLVECSHMSGLCGAVV